MPSTSLALVRRSSRAKQKPPASLDVNNFLPGASTTPAGFGGHLDEDGRPAASVNTRFGGIEPSSIVALPDLDRNPKPVPSKSIVVA